MSSTGGGGPVRVRGDVKLGHSAGELLKAPVPTNREVTRYLGTPESACVDMLGCSSCHILVCVCAHPWVIVRYLGVLPDRSVHTWHGTDGSHLTWCLLGRPISARLLFLTF